MCLNSTPRYHKTCKFCSTLTVKIVFCYFFWRTSSKIHWYPKITLNLPATCDAVRLKANLSWVDVCQTLMPMHNAALSYEKWISSQILYGSCLKCFDEVDLVKSEKSFIPAITHISNVVEGLYLVFLEEWLCQKKKLHFRKCLHQPEYNTILNLFCRIVSINNFWRGTASMVSISFDNSGLGAAPLGMKRRVCSWKGLTIYDYLVNVVAIHDQFYSLNYSAIKQHQHQYLTTNSFSTSQSNFWHVFRSPPNLLCSNVGILAAVAFPCCSLKS